VSKRWRINREVQHDTKKEIDSSAINDTRAVGALGYGLRQLLRIEWGTSNALSGTSWVIDDLDNKDSDPDLDDRVVAFASDGSFYGVWYDDYATDLSHPTTDDPMSGSGVDQAKPSGDTVEITINEVYDGAIWFDPGRIYAVLEGAY
jgi:hypothetical protein